MSLKSVPWWVALLVGAVGATGGFGAGLAGGFLTFSRPSVMSSAVGDSSQPATGQPAAKKTYTRAEIRDVANWCRTEAEVQKRLGKPDYTTEQNSQWAVSGPNGGGGSDRIITYHYKRISRDDTGSGKVDSECRITLGTIGENVVFIP